MNCPACGRPLCNKSEHHFWWPKKRYRGTKFRRVTTFLHPKCHSEYHMFYLRNCLYKGCFKDNCKYQTVCCYYLKEEE